MVHCRSVRIRRSRHAVANAGWAKIPDRVAHVVAELPPQVAHEYADYVAVGAAAPSHTRRRRVSWSTMLPKRNSVSRHCARRSSWRCRCLSGSSAGKPQPTVAVADEDARGGEGLAAIAGHRAEPCRRGKPCPHPPGRWLLDDPVPTHQRCPHRCMPTLNTPNEGSKTKGPSTKGPNTRPLRGDDLQSPVSTGGQRERARPRRVRVLPLASSLRQTPAVGLPVRIAQPSRFRIALNGPLQRLDPYCGETPTYGSVG